MNKKLQSGDDITQVFKNASNVIASIVGRLPFADVRILDALDTSPKSPVQINAIGSKRELCIGPEFKRRNGDLGLWLIGAMIYGMCPNDQFDKAEDDYHKNGLRRRLAAWHAIRETITQFPALHDASREFLSIQWTGEEFENQNWRDYPERIKKLIAEAVISALAGGNPIPLVIRRVLEGDVQQFNCAEDAEIFVETVERAAEKLFQKWKEEKGQGEGQEEGQEEGQGEGEGEREGSSKNSFDVITHTMRDERNLGNEKQEQEGGEKNQNGEIGPRRYIDEVKYRTETYRDRLPITNSNELVTDPVFREILVAPEYGVISGRLAGMLAQPVRLFSDGRMFRRKIVNIETPDIALIVAVDGSGSMADHQVYGTTGWQKMLDSEPPSVKAFLLHNLLAGVSYELGLPFESFCYNGAGTAATIRIISDASGVPHIMTKPFAHGDNGDGEAVAWAATRASQIPGKKIVVILADGHFTRQSVSFVANLVAQTGVHIIHVDYGGYGKSQFTGAHFDGYNLASRAFAECLRDAIND
jgi:hypothetical protein